MTTTHELDYVDPSGLRCACVALDDLSEEQLRELVRPFVDGRRGGREHFIVWYPDGLVTLVSERDFDLDYRHAAMAGAQTS